MRRTRDGNLEDIILSLRNLKKSFGDTQVLRGINLDVKKGEFVTLLGPSGCGKTTVLRIIAGLLDADEGQVILEGKDVTEAPPEKRNVNTVFQSYALFPHMNVGANVGYALRIRGEKKAKIKEEVARVLSLVQLEGYERRMPHELSGGQRQRVAIARAVIAEPKVLLLDEPLGALDLQLRRQMQIELKKLQRTLGITFIYITHDQEEALNMSNRIAVMRGGVFEQIGTPAEVYDTPRTSYVARFVGEANIICGKVVSASDGFVTLSAAGGVVTARDGGIDFSAGDDVTISVRRENIQIIDEPQDAVLRATVKEKSFVGGLLRINLELDDGVEIIATRCGIDSPHVPGDVVYVKFSPEHAVAVREQP